MHILLQYHILIKKRLYLFKGHTKSSTIFCKIETLLIDSHLLAYRNVPSQLGHQQRNAPAALVSVAALAQAAG